MEIMRDTSANPGRGSETEIKKNVINAILELKKDTEIYWRIQAENEPLPEASWDGWDNVGYSEGEVSFYATLENALFDLQDDGKSDFEIAHMLKKAGKVPVLLAARSEYKIEDGPMSEIILTDPVEIARFRLSPKDIDGLLEELD